MLLISSHCAAQALENAWYDGGAGAAGLAIKSCSRVFPCLSKDALIVFPRCCVLNPGTTGESIISRLPALFCEVCCWSFFSCTKFFYVTCGKTSFFAQSKTAPLGHDGTQEVVFLQLPSADDKKKDDDALDDLVFVFRFFLCVFLIVWLVCWLIAG